MRIIVCFKYVRDDADISINPDYSLNTSKAPWIVSPYDLNAVEAAMRLASEVPGATVEVLTLGGEVLADSKMQKAILARGPEKLYLVQQEEPSIDSYANAQMLKEAIDHIGPVDLIICGEGSGDLYYQMTGTMLGALLGIPVLNSVSELSFTDAELIATRNAQYTERYKLSGPALVSVTSDICPSRIPSMKDILAAGKKPVETIDASGFTKAASAVVTQSILAPEQTERKQLVFKGDAEGIEEFSKLIKRNL